MPPLDKKGNPDWERIYNRGERNAQKWGIIATVTVVVLTLVILLFRGHLGTFFSQLGMPKSIDGKVISREGEELDERDLKILEEEAKKRAREAEIRPREAGGE